MQLRGATEKCYWVLLTVGAGSKGAGIGAGKDAALQHPKHQTSPITIGAASVATIAAAIAG